MSQLTNTPMSQRRRLTVAVFTTALVIVAFFMPLPAVASAPQAWTIEINARQFAYEPATLNAQRGDTITLHLESLDAAHGLFVDGYDVDLHAEPSKSAQATFVADKEGKFKFRCSVPCGALHPFMIGELNVEPNLPLARAMVATFIAVIGTIAFFWRTNRVPAYSKDAGV